MGEGGVAQILELPGAVLADVPRVVRLARSRLRELQHVRRRDVCDPSRREDLAEVLEHADRVLYVLDRLQADHRVEFPRLAMRFHHAPLEAQVLTAVAK